MYILDVRPKKEGRGSSPASNPVVPWGRGPSFSLLCCVSHDVKASLVPPFSLLSLLCVSVCSLPLCPANILTPYQHRPLRTARRVCRVFCILRRNATHAALSISGKIAAWWWCIAALLLLARGYSLKYKWNKIGEIFRFSSWSRFPRVSGHSSQVPARGGCCHW